MGLSLLSQPAQAINWDFSYTNSSGNSFTGTLTSDGGSFLTNNIYNLTGISGTVTNNGTPVSVSALYVFADNRFLWDGGTAIALTASGIAFLDADNNYYNLYSTTADIGDTENFNQNGLFVSNFIDTSGSVTSSSLTPATPVPWETDALSVIGSTVLFAGSLWAKNKFAKPLQK